MLPAEPCQRHLSRISYDLVRFGSGGGSSYLRFCSMMHLPALNPSCCSPSNFISPRQITTTPTIYHTHIHTHTHTNRMPAESDQTAVWQLAEVL